jgi:hypothetical protein
MKDKVLAIDFDGTIHDVFNPIPGRRMGSPIEGAKTALDTLKSQGFRLVIHTIWADSEAKVKTITDWLNYWKIPFDEVTNIKPAAERYIDDKALEFTDWETTLKKLQTSLK